MIAKFDDVVDQRLEVRRHEMAVALRWSAGLFIAFALVTLDVIFESLILAQDERWRRA